MSGITLHRGEEMKMQLKPHFFSFFHLYVIFFLLLIWAYMIHDFFQSWEDFEFPGYMNTNILEHVVASRRGLPPRESRRIYEVLQERADVLRGLREKEITNFYELHTILTQAYREGLFR